MRKANHVYTNNDRDEFSVIYHELWDCYLPYLGPAAVLLYCYLLRLAREGVAGPSSSAWSAEVCAPLGLSVPDSHQAWARLQEFGLISADREGSYSLLKPKRREAFQAMVAEYSAVQQATVQPLTVQPAVKAEVSKRALRSQRGKKSLFSVFEQEFGRALSGAEAEKVIALEQTYSRELAELALEIAVIAQVRNLSYIEQILVNWRLKGIDTVEAARRDAESHRHQKAQRSQRANGKSAGAKGDKAVPTQPSLWDDLDIYKPRPKEGKQ